MQSKLAAALLGAIVTVTVVGVAVKAGDTTVVGIPIRLPDAGYDYVEVVADVLPDGGIDIPDKGTVVGDVLVSKCAAKDAAFCLAKSERTGGFPCVIPLDATCLRTYQGTDAGRWAGFNVMPVSESSGNCKPVQCVILAGDKAP